MIAYLDTSVILRIVMREPNPLQEWDRIIIGVTSDLTRIEAARAMDRLTILRTVNEEQLIEKQTETANILHRLDYIEIDEPAIVEATHPLPFILGALDSIHLASAILYRSTQPKDEPPLLFATHDQQLARAAEALHFEILGA